MDRYSRTEKLVVDPGYVFDFYRAGYDVVLGLNYSFFFDVTGADYDYVIGGPTSIRDKVPECLHAIETDRIGSFDDPFACRSILYRHPSRQGPSIDD